MATAKNTTMNTAGQIFLQDPDFLSSRCIRPEEDCWTTVPFLEELPYCFPQWLSPFTLHQWCTRAPHQCFFSLVFLMTVILTGMRCYPTAVLICTSMMISDTEHLYMYLLATCEPSVEKCLFKLLCSFFNWVI